MRTLFLSLVLSLTATAAFSQSMVCWYTQEGDYRGRDNAGARPDFTAGITTRPADQPLNYPTDWQWAYVTAEDEYCPTRIDAAADGTTTAVPYAP